MPSLSLTQPLGSALTPKPSRRMPVLLLALGCVVALGATAYGYLESQRMEQVVIAVRAVPYGQQIRADDLGMIAVSAHRPIQIAGITDPAQVIGRWAARPFGVNDLMQPTMVQETPPDQPVYPTGQQLDKDTVPVPLSLATIGPLTELDRVNVGYTVQQGDPALCRADGTTGIGRSAADPAEPSVLGRPFACRLLQRLKVLYVDHTQGVVYVQMTPYQAHAIWALQAANVQLWGERYGATSDALPTMDRLDASQVDAERLTMTLTETLMLTGIPGNAGALPAGTGVHP